LNIVYYDIFYRQVISFFFNFQLGKKIFIGRDEHSLTHFKALIIYLLNYNNKKIFILINNYLFEFICINIVFLFILDDSMFLKTDHLTIQYSGYKE